jgi:hypothetical protein
MSSAGHESEGARHIVARGIEHVAQMLPGDHPELQASLEIARIRGPCTTWGGAMMAVAPGVRKGACVKVEWPEPDEATYQC